MQFPLSEEDCFESCKQYSDTVVILAALYRLFALNKELGRYVGIELKMHSKEGDSIEPDFITMYNEDNNGLLFELKWSVPKNPELLENELKDMGRYFNEFIDWRNSTKKVIDHDVVMICNIRDVNRLIALVQVLCNQTEFTFLKSNFFSIWGWSLISSKGINEKEEIRLEKIYGKINNKKLNELLDKPSGILVTEDVLRFARYSFFFVKEKPPISYLIAMIIQHILNPYPSDPWQKSFVIDLDSIMNKCEIFFPSWRDYDKTTKQVKRNWINEGLKCMCELDIIQSKGKDAYEVPIPLYRKRMPLIQALCKDLFKTGEKRRKSGKRINIKQKEKINIGPLDKYFSTNIK